MFIEYSKDSAVSHTTRTEVTKTSRISLNGTQLRKALGLPDNAILSVGVPGGGDWSNCTLVIGEDGIMLDAEWREHAVETE